MRLFNNKGFSLLEAIIALVLAASGMAIVFQSVGDATKTQSIVLELNRAKIVAHNILAEMGLNPITSNGITDGIAWTVSAQPIANNKNGDELIRIKIIASGPSGRQVILTTETVQRAL